jgi:SAM-dependent methyltransferase
MYYNDTIDINMNEIYNLFIPYLPENGSILDIGCGSGRDTKYFLSKGFKVTALEPSSELARLAEENTGIKILNTLVQNISYQDKFHGIWACASLLHLPFNDMNNVLKKLYSAMKYDGVLFISLKKGDFEGWRNGRYFCDYTFEKFKKTNFKFIGFSLLNYYESLDKRDGCNEKVWINITLKKNNFNFF